MKAARRALLFLGVAGFSAGGCGSGVSYEHATVRGKVTYEGKPVTFGSVLFIPVDPPKDGMLQPASGSISPDGAYELTSQSKPGAIVGEHKVLVIAVEGTNLAQPSPNSKESRKTQPSKARQAPTVLGQAAQVDKTPDFKMMVPKKYADPTTTPLVRKVVPGDNTIDIELTK